MVIWGCSYYRFKYQLQKILTASPDTEDLVKSLSTTSLVRREILYLQETSQQQAIELQRQQYILELAPIGYLHIDRDNQLLWCNQQARQLLHIDRWQPGQVRLFLELVRSYELDQLIEKTRNTQTAQVEEWVFYKTPYVSQVLVNNGAIALKGTGYPLQNQAVAVFLENQQPLVELSQSRDRAFSDLTHELRTPLTSIFLVAETLQTHLENPERRWVEKLLKETTRLIHLVEDWLDLSEIENNLHRNLTYERLALDKLILSAWQTLDPLAQKTQVTLDCHGSSEIQFSGDRSRLYQAFLNLLDNSFKHSPSGSTIQVHLKLCEINQAIEVDIIDCGSGFSEADLPYIFNRLYRGDISRVRAGNDTQSLRQGSGLGLAITQEIVHAHGGSITAKNHPDTHGAWVKVVFPT
ncbi:MAG: sensor histidine kinase [cyanobacterium endosymbiont of Rhopalodia musculus]|uniref:sensor histidine kinase n=1 Tax=cyanobacterium endosymbiont of Epithemia clementina EcSB TaxID=3034674 RepID=UPI0024806BBA|nr:PAS domain-containing sensor histidine kinase [cyanobacterium endosymbiont of Epithemia clementina EcSB]WGT67406.1 PAS domain-containing sensor histidine kinase [cyanobacterium endosymbiont of Epithemia clementina EcSB]